MKHNQRIDLIGLIEQALMDSRTAGVYWGEHNQDRLQWIEKSHEAAHLSKKALLDFVNALEVQ